MLGLRPWQPKLLGEYRLEVAPRVGMDERLLDGAPKGARRHLGWCLWGVGENCLEEVEIAHGTIVPVAEDSLIPTMGEPTSAIVLG